MGSAIAVGPLLIAVDRGLTILCIIIFLALAALAERLGAARVSSVAMCAVLLGLVVARAAYVVLHWSSYRDEPWSILAVWQGGFSPVFGVLGAAVALAVRLGAQRSLAAAWGALAVPTMLWFALQAWIPPLDYGRFQYDARLMTLDGRPLDLEKFRGRPFVVNLGATWCGPCRRELPMLLTAAGQDGALPILLANQGEASATVTSYLARENLGGANVALDQDRQLSRAFESAGYPTTAFVAADGTIVQLQFGELSRAALADGIDMTRNHK